MLKQLFSSLKLENIKTMIKRFPIPFVIIIGLTFLLFLLNNLDYYSSTVSKAVFTFVLVFFLSLGVYLSVEDLKITNLKKSLLQLFPIAFGVLFYMFFEVEFDYYDNLVFYIICLTGISMYVFFAPFISKFFKKDIDNKLYYQYFYKIAIVFLFGFILGLLLFLLGSLAIIAIDLLFELDWRWLNDFYSNWAIFSLSLVTPIVCLMEIPSKNQVLDKKFTINSFFSFIIKYVFSIFFIIYFIILYAYSIKVLLNFGDWPKGEVCWLVIIFSIFAYISYILSYYFDDTTNLIKKIRKFTPFVVVPQVFMLFYAIYLRISQYDLTINRYFVVVFGIWLLIISLYFIISKKKDLVVIPSIITLFTIVICVGPWSVFSLPETRQMARLEDNLTKAGILREGKIYPLNDYNDIDKELSREIYNGIQYICYDLNCDHIAKLFDKNLNVLGRWGVIDEVTSEIKVKSYYPTATSESTTIYINAQNPGLFPVELDDYKYFTELVSANNNKNDIQTDARFNEFGVIVDAQTYQLKIVEKNEITEIINMGELGEDIYNKIVARYGDIYNEKYQGLPIDDLTFEFTGKKYEIKIMISSISFLNPKNKDNEDYNNYYGYIDGYALVKEI